MSIYCADLLELDCFQEISLIGGEKGLYRQISWPFICTTPTISQWTHGEELVFITGAGIKSNENSLLELMKECIDRNLAGMVILKGDNYIPAIPTSMIDLANQSHFPLFEMPWTFKLIDVTQRISQLVIEHQNKLKKHTSFFKQLLFSDSKVQNFEELSMHGDITPRRYQFIALISMKNSISIDIEVIKNNVIRTINNYSLGKSREIICMDYSNTVICLALGNNHNCITKLENSIIEAFNMLENQYPNIELKLGFGRTCENGNLIQQSYFEAKKVITLISQNLISKNHFHYCDLGIFRLLFEIKNPDKIKSYCTENIGRLVDTDKKNNSELLKTLQCYFSNNCNLLRTSEALFIHRNTLIYRLNLIHEILDKDLDDSLVRLELYLSIIAAKFLDSIGK